MDAQRIRPSLRDLSSPDADPNSAKFSSFGTAVTVTRRRPPQVGSSAMRTSAPDHVPVIFDREPIPDSAGQTAPTAPTAPMAKPKSRFALHRERERREEALRVAVHGQVQGEASLHHNATGAYSLVGQVVERASSELSVEPPRPVPHLLGAGASPSPAALPLGFPVSVRHTPTPLKEQTQVLPQSKPQSQSLPSSSSTAWTSKLHSPVTTTREVGDIHNPNSMPAILASVSDENDRLLAGMSDQEILDQQREIKESMGLSDELLKILEARSRRSKVLPSMESDLPTTSTAQVQVGGKGLLQSVQDDTNDAEGSPESIRKHYFPQEPASANLDWMKPNQTINARVDSAGHYRHLVFSLNGAFISSAEGIGEAPKVSALHHVSSSSAFTITTLMSLALSSVPSQRSSALQTLLRILSCTPSHEPKFGKEAWLRLELDIAQRACHALLDATVGVRSVALDLLSFLIETECRRPREAFSWIRPQGLEESSLLSTLLIALPFAVLEQELLHARLPTSASRQVLRILKLFIQLTLDRSSPPFVELDAIVDTPNLLEAVTKHFIAIPWPRPAAQDPTVLATAADALAMLSDLARSSRARTKSIVSRYLAEPALRFLGVPPWELDSASPAARWLTYGLVNATFDLWQTLAQYGLGTSLRTTAASLLSSVLDRAAFLLGDAMPIDACEIHMVVALLRLLRIWTITAIDPHVSEHDILWSHIDGWENLALLAHRRGLQDASPTLIAAAWNLWTVWLEGSKVNSAWRGEMARNWIQEHVATDFEDGKIAILAVKTAFDRIKCLDITRSIGFDAELVVAAVRFSTTFEEDSNLSTPALFYLDGSSVVSFFDSVVPKMAVMRSPAPDVSLVQLLILLLRHIPTTSIRFSRTVDTLRFLRAGDEVAARDLLEWMIRVVHPFANHSMPPLASLDADLELSALSNAAVLRPFLMHAVITSSGGRVTGPDHPTPRDIKLTACLPPFCSKDTLLHSDWPLVALDELLRSGTSPVFQSLPKDWNASELDLVRTSLALMRLVVNTGEVSARIQPRRMIYDLIKVFMLETDNPITPSTRQFYDPASTDLYRHQGVDFSLRNLLTLWSVAVVPQQLNKADARSSEDTLEGHSATVSSPPFYRTYSDLLGLYDSISLGHEVFAWVLLPPLAMSYPVEYRRLLWNDYAHLLRQIRTRVEDAISDCDDPEARLSCFLAPAETDLTVLCAYAKALSLGDVTQAQTPLLYLIGVHHLANALFSASVDSTTRSKLADAVVVGVSDEVFKALARYDQAKDGAALRWGATVWLQDDDDEVKRKWTALRGLVSQSNRCRLDKLISVQP
ncbi:BQ5605_C014g07467 [Microbotryum silenes-dioicae]|uniref:BQ5605_C014g07467 protein n=1 Tax=Microbotryum silenes-dioicae TaxID=796604 RepID=A0A2X0MF89_9BASI|nr:BQ5605_C014g07467 [Microbotryum silenes-dioicae]